MQLSDGSETQVQNFTISVVDPNSQPIVLLDEDFSSCPSDWTIYSVSGGNYWECSDNGYLYVNAYGGSVAAKDWIVSPKLPASQFDEITFSFDAYTKYSDNGVDYPPVKVLLSTDYVPGDNPEDYTWADATGSWSYPSEDSQNWQNSGDIVVINSNHKDIYIAFKYISSGTAAQECALWQIDNLYVEGTKAAATPVEQTNTEFKIYPNPVTNDNIRIKTPANTQVSVQIYSINGKTVYSKTTTSNGEISIDFKAPKGIYFIKIKSDNGIYTGKIIKL